MSRRKPIRTRGNLKLSRYFQNLENGDVVAVIKETAVQFSFPERLQGRTGIVEKKQGRSVVVKIKDQEKEKEFLISPIHLKKIENSKTK